MVVLVKTGTLFPGQCHFHMPFQYIVCKTESSLSQYFTLVNIHQGHFLHIVLVTLTNQYFFALNTPGIITKGNILFSAVEEVFFSVQNNSADTMIIYCQ